tara:strand:+ start:308 stop:574 length:267 start_codon:yes stop_codon:yes gene_type:complete
MQSFRVSDDDVFSRRRKRFLDNKKMLCLVCGGVAKEGSLAQFLLPILFAFLIVNSVLFVPKSRSLPLDSKDYYSITTSTIYILTKLDV